MTQLQSMAQRIGQAAIAFEEHRLARRPTSVTVLLGGDTLVITMHGVLSRGEMILAESAAGATTLQAFHQALFNDSSEPLRQEIRSITGLELATTGRPTAAVQVFPTGTVVQVFLLHGQLLDADHWTGA